MRRSYCGSNGSCRKHHHAVLDRRRLRAREADAPWTRMWDQGKLERSYATDQSTTGVPKSGGGTRWLPGSHARQLRFLDRLMQFQPLRHSVLKSLRSSKQILNEKSRENRAAFLAIAKHSDRSRDCAVLCSVLPTWLDFPTSLSLAVEGYLVTSPHAPLPHNRPTLMPCANHLHALMRACVFTTQCCGVRATCDHSKALNR